LVVKLTGTIELSMHKRERGRVVYYREAVPAKHFGPLAVHRDVMYGKRQTWKITHVATGLGVAGELTLKAAVGMARALRDLPEWADPHLAGDVSLERTCVIARLARAVEGEKEKWV
jgi:hypothetical protein